GGRSEARRPAGARRFTAGLEEAGAVRRSPFDGRARSSVAEAVALRLREVAAVLAGLAAAARAVDAGVGREYRRVRSGALGVDLLDVDLCRIAREVASCLHADV